MLISDLFSEIHMAIVSNKARTSLTILGIVIGIASVIVMIAIGNGSQKSIQESIQSIGSNLLTIQPGQQKSFGGGARSSGSSQSLTIEDSDAIEKKIKNIKAIAPISSGNEQLIANGNNMQYSTNGVTSSYSQVNNIEIANGSFISDVHVSKRSKVIVIGPDVKTELFGESENNIIGKKIRIGGLNFTVIGVSKSKGSGGFGNADETVYIPLTTYQQYFSGNKYLSSIGVSINDQEQMDLAEEEITAFLLKKHKIKNVENADFNIRNQADIIEMTSSITGALTILLGAVAGISLVVGGIGIMNMMLTNVTERTREIGLRKSIGANQADIKQQFLFEAIILTFVGGVIGIVLGIIIAYGLNRFGVTSTEVSGFSIVLSFSVSTVIGVVFGYYPARRAAGLNPIEALRYE